METYSGFFSLAKNRRTTSCTTSYKNKFCTKVAHNVVSANHTKPILKASKLANKQQVKFLFSKIDFKARYGLSEHPNVESLVKTMIVSRMPSESLAQRLEWFLDHAKNNKLENRCVLVSHLWQTPSVFFENIKSGAKREKRGC